MSEEVEALIHPSDDGKFWAEVIGLNGCYAQGENYSKIMTHLRDAHELCSNSPALPSPPPTEINLDQGITVASLQTTLAAHGWSPTNETTALNRLLAHKETGAKLCLPADEAEVLNIGFRTAVTDYLAQK